MNSSPSSAQAISVATVDPREVAHYRRLAETWWDPAGPFWPVHRLNDVRVPWILERVCQHYTRSVSGQRPLRGLDVLDIGCGGGVLSEAMARLGARVHGIDLVDRNIEVASSHAAGAGLELRYEFVSAEHLLERKPRYDVILNMEVVEHVADLPGFMAAAAGLLRPEGMMFVATINRTPLAWLFAIFAAEYVLRWMPRGTHRYRLLRKPKEIEALLARDGLVVRERTGVKVNPLKKQLSLTSFLDVNYMLSASRSVSTEGGQES